MFSFSHGVNSLFPVLAGWERIGTLRTFVSAVPTSLRFPLPFFLVETPTKRSYFLLPGKFLLFLKVPLPGGISRKDGPPLPKLLGTPFPSLPLPQSFLLPPHPLSSSGATPTTTSSFVSCPPLLSVSFFSSPLTLFSPPPPF